MHLFFCILFLNLPTKLYQLQTPQKVNYSLVIIHLQWLKNEVSKRLIKEKIHLYPPTLHQINTSVMNQEAGDAVTSLRPYNTPPPLTLTMKKSFPITSVRWEGLWGNHPKSLAGMSFRGSGVWGFPRDF